MRHDSRSRSCILIRDHDQTWQKISQRRLAPHIIKKGTPPHFCLSKQAWRVGRQLRCAFCSVLFILGESHTLYTSPFGFCFGCRSPSHSGHSSMGEIVWDGLQISIDQVKDRTSVCEINQVHLQSWMEMMIGRLLPSPVFRSERLH